MTTARWIREFVMKHPEYKQDSVVSETINFDLNEAFQRITSGERDCPELLISYDTKSAGDIPHAKEMQESFLADKAQKKQNGHVV